MMNGSGTGFTVAAILRSVSVDLFASISLALGDTDVVMKFVILSRMRLSHSPTVASDNGGGSGDDTSIRTVIVYPSRRLWSGPPC